MQLTHLSDGPLMAEKGDVVAPWNQHIYVHFAKDRLSVERVTERERASEESLGERSRGRRYVVTWITRILRV